MKLDWKRAGRASIAENGGFTLAVFPDYWPGEWGWRAITSDDKSNIAVEHGSRICTREAAESSAEQWLESHDRPKWHDATDWLSWAEWRGREVSIHTYAPVYGGSDRRWWVDISPRHTHGFDTLTEAKEYAEKWIREHGAQ